MTVTCFPLYLDGITNAPEVLKSHLIIATVSSASGLYVKGSASTIEGKKAMQSRISKIDRVYFMLPLRSYTISILDKDAN